MIVYRSVVTGLWRLYPQRQTGIRTRKRKRHVVFIALINATFHKDRPIFYRVTLTTDRQVRALVNNNNYYYCYFPLKSRLKNFFYSLRLLPNTDPTCGQRLWGYDRMALYKFDYCFFYPR